MYVFSAGFIGGGDQHTASDAVARILGRTGERLGSSLATADLNNDGYREIIIGGPGSNTIHIVRGGPALTGTIDLSVTPAAVTFTNPGLGLRLAAGDITGDGIYDLLVGHPSVNAVHVLKGRNGTMPPAAFDMSFWGIDAGDGVGTSIRIADVDARQISDVILGAPGADGPSNSRTNAGEVYLLWGGPTVAGRSLQLADVTFFSNIPGARMGELLAGGDINRDTPNDVVFGCPGARGGAGRLDIYYGRERGAIGVPRGDGSRVVDFASENPDRGILGDTRGGTITAAQVYEVTGEGARDVIVGMSGNGGGIGSRIFHHLPAADAGSTKRFDQRLSRPPQQRSGPGSATSARFAITWRTSSDRAWLTATPQGSASATAPWRRRHHRQRPGTRAGILHRYDHRDVDERPPA